MKKDLLGLLVVLYICEVGIYKKLLDYIKKRTYMEIF